jgi:hypothetical protein
VRPAGRGEAAPVDVDHDAAMFDSKLGVGPTGLVVALALAAGACSEGDDAGSANVTAACDRLEELGAAILDVRSAASVDEVRSGVGPALEAFVDAARESGDPRLGELSSTAAERFEVYLTDDGIDGREAGNDADIALDRSIERCVELGAPNDFPEEPGT